MTKYKNEIALGSFTLAGAILLGYMTLTVGKFQFGPTTNVKAVFDSASGVVKDAVVMVAGVEVGHVKKIDLENNKAAMSIILNDDVKISKNVKGVIRAKSLLGEKFVELIPYNSKEVLVDGDVITNTQTPVELDQLVTNLGPILIRLGPVLEKVNPEDITDMFKTISRGLKGKEKYLSRIIINVDEMLVFFSSNKSRMLRIIENVDSISNEAGSMLRNNRPGIDRIVDNTDKIMGSFGQRSDKLAERINVITTNLQDITNDLQKNSPGLIKKVDKLTDDLSIMSSDFRTNAPDLAKHINSVTKNLDKMLVSLDKDAPDLVKDLSSVTKTLASLSEQISKKGPKMIDNTDELLLKLNETFKRLEPLMARLEKFDDKAIIKEVERVMRQVGIKVNLY